MKNLIIAILSCAFILTTSNTNGQSAKKIMKNLNKRILIVHIIKDISLEEIKTKDNFNDKKLMGNNLKYEIAYNKLYNASMKKMFNKKTWKHNDSIIFLTGDEIKKLKNPSKYLILTKAGIEKYTVRKVLKVSSSYDVTQYFRLVKAEKARTESVYGGYRKPNVYTFRTNKNKSIFTRDLFELQYKNPDRNLIKSFSKSSKLESGELNVDEIDQNLFELTAIEFEVWTSIKQLNYYVGREVERLKLKKNILKDDRIGNDTIFAFSSDLKGLDQTAEEKGFNPIVKVSNVNQIKNSDVKLILFCYDVVVTRTNEKGHQSISFYVHYYLIDAKNGIVKFSKSKNDERKERKITKMTEWIIDDLMKQKE